MRCPILFEICLSEKNETWLYPYIAVHLDAMTNTNSVQLLIRIFRTVLRHKALVFLNDLPRKHLNKDWLFKSAQHLQLALQICSKIFIKQTHLYREREWQNVLLNRTKVWKPSFTTALRTVRYSFQAHPQPVMLHCSEPIQFTTYLSQL